MMRLPDERSAARLGCLALLISLAACASVRPAPSATPDFAPPAGRAAPPHAALYSACIAEAIGAGRLELSAEASTQLLRFTCRGAPALAMFDALAAWSPTNGSQWTREGRTWRSTTRIQRNLFGADYCSAGHVGAAPECSISLNAGAFLVAPSGAQ